MTAPLYVILASCLVALVLGTAIRLGIAAALEDRERDRPDDPPLQV